MGLGSDMREQQFDATCRPLTRASALPGECYTSAEWYRREVERIFWPEWVCLGREDLVPSAGDYYRIDVVGEPIVVVRDSAGKVNAFSAVCRHRGTVLVAGAGNCRSFQCPYHGWTYSLQGNLVSTPGSPNPMEEVENFDKGNYGLVRLRLETWAGFIFVNLDARARPLLERLGELPEKAKNYKLASMRTTKHFPYEAGCNWKVYLENGMEPYHVNFVHHRHVNRTRERVWSFEETGAYGVLNVMSSISEISGFPVIEGLTAEERETTAFVWVQPNMLLLLAATYMKFRLFLPLGPGRVRLVEHWCFPPASIGHPDFEASVGPAYYDKYEQISQDDLVVTPMIQEGLGSSFYRPGRYSPQEQVVHQIARYVINRVEGERESARP